LHAAIGIRIRPFISNKLIYNGCITDHTQARLNRNLLNISCSETDTHLIAIAAKQYERPSIIIKRLDEPLLIIQLTPNRSIML
jgi:hypothetical protein